MAYIGNTSTTQSFTPAIDYFSGNGSTTAFTLSRPVASVAQVQVVVNNVTQNPGSAFTISSNTITFTGAPSSGTNNIYVYYTSPITQLISPGQGTVGVTQLSATGTPSSSTYLRGDNTWATVSGGVTSAVAGNGIAVSAATGAVTFSAAAPTQNTIGSYAFVSGGSVFGTNYAAGTIVLASIGSQYVSCIAVTVLVPGGTANSLSGTWKWMSMSSGYGIAVRVA